MPAPLLSVVIPTHKRPAILRECLRHLERQTVRDHLEVIVVSDGHDAETAALLAPCHGERRRTIDTGQRDMARVDPSSPLRVTRWCEEHVRYFEIPKSQQGVARNRGVQEAKGEYVLFIGDDIFLSSDACERHLQAHRQLAIGSWQSDGSSDVSKLHAKSHKPIAILGHVTWDPQVGVTPVMRWLEKTGWQFGYPMITRYAHAMIPRDIQHRFTYTSNLSLPANVARTHPFLATDLYGWEDVEWGKRLAETDVRLFYEPDALGWHHHKITLEDSLERMKTLGKSVAAMAKRDPSFDRMPQGWKLWAYRGLSIVPTMRGRHAKAFLRGIQAYSL